MEVLRTSLRRIGNSYGFVVPKPILTQMDFDAEVQLTIEGDALVLDQLQAVDKARLAKRMGTLTAKTLANTLEGLKELFAR